MGFTVVLIAGPDQASSSITVTGSTQHVITDTERNTFGLSDSVVKDAVAKIKGKRPDDAYLHSPTPWNDLYKTWNWNQVTTIVEPAGAMITDISSSPCVIGSNTQTNHSSVVGTFSFGVMTSVTESSESNWNVSNTISVSETTTYSVGSKAFASASESITFTYGHTWGTGGSQTSTTTVGANQKITVKLQPGQSAIADLTMNKGTIHAKIFWKARLTGAVAVNYGQAYEGHHFYPIAVEDVLAAMPRENYYTTVETMTYGFYANAQTVLRNT